MKKLLLTLLLVLSISLVPVASHAIEYGGLGGRPANPREDNARSASIFVYQLEPKTSYNDGVLVSNNTNEKKTIRIGAVDSIAASDGAFACAQNSEDRLDVGSWVKLSKDSVTLESGTTEVVDFTITVPQNASTGEHSGCITIQEDKAPSAGSDGGIVLSFRSAIRVSITIPGDIVKAITVSGVKLNPKTDDAKQFTIQPTLTNTGNVSLDTEITTRLVSAFGTVASETTSTYPVLPRTSARWNFDVNRPFWGGWYRATVNATYNANVAEGIGQTGNEKKETVKGASSYAFVTPSPLALLIEALVVVGFLATILVLVRRLRHRRVVKNHWSHHTVVENDSLQKIAKQYHVSWKRVASANKIRAPYHLEPGTKIKVPPHSLE
jgi:hypothetical protein